MSVFGGFLCQNVFHFTQSLLVGSNFFNVPYINITTLAAELNPSVRDRIFLQKLRVQVTSTMLCYH